MYDELRMILIEDLGCSDEDVRPEASREEAGLDSIAMVELSIALDHRLGIDIGEDELLRVTTVADIARLITERRAAHEAH